MYGQDFDLGCKEPLKLRAVLQSQQCEPFVIGELPGLRQPFENAHDRVGGIGDLADPIVGHVIHHCISSRLAKGFQDEGREQFAITRLNHLKDGGRLAPPGHPFLKPREEFGFSRHSR